MKGLHGLWLESQYSQETCPFFNSPGWLWSPPSLRFWGFFHGSKVAGELTTHLHLVPYMPLWSGQGELHLSWKSDYKLILSSLISTPNNIFLWDKYSITSVFNTKLQELFTCLPDTIMFRHVTITHFGFIKFLNYMSQENLRTWKSRRMEPYT